LARSRPGDRLRLQISWDDDAVRVSCAVARVDAATSTPATRPRPDPEMEISAQILGALVDEQGVDVVDGEPTAWIRKKRSST